jgi:hypothetical protein
MAKKKKNGKGHPKSKTRSAAKSTKRIAKKKSKNTATRKKSAIKRKTAIRKMIEVRTPGADSAGQAGDLQGLSNLERADSESVDELLEEGNAFEADAVQGVEEADNVDEKEVRTHEVPEDDVPGEYLDKR